MRPFKRCLGCNRSLKDIGGRRIISTSNAGIEINPRFTTIDSEYILEKHQPLYFRIIDKKRLLTYWGEIWNNLTLNFIIETIENIKNDNLIPWICQECARFDLCIYCMRPKEVDNSTIMDSDGNKFNITSLKNNKCFYGCED